MIRRAFWLGLGAVLGVAGYRRLSRLGRALTGSRNGPAAIRAAGQIGGGTTSFVRDVRAGMAEYLDGTGEYLNRHAGG